MILMYHKVDIITPTIWWVTPGDLNRHIANLKDKRFVFLSDYRDPESEVVVTFDDAYENLFHHALPVLRAHQIPFEVFVIGDRIGDWNDFDSGEPQTRHMSPQHLEDVGRSGGRLQWHTRTHPEVSKLTDEDMEREMTVPERLRLRFPHPHFTWFSYPYGVHDDRAVSMAKRRFEGAVSVTEGQPNDRWQMNRITVDRHTALSPQDISEILRLPLAR
jgi:peptidoglycan/xylan/chitin deacetylase (PgdA/CDA1 family)